MPSPLLVTKLYIPCAPTGHVARPHLIDQINTGLNGKLTMVSAPAGAGKTCLLSTWIEQSDRPCGWVSLDEDDNSPTRFLTYMIAALQTIHTTIGDTILPALQSPQPPSPSSVLACLVSEIAEHSKLALVFDDYHVIHSKDVHEIISELLQHMPPNLHLVIATRADPPLPLPRLRGRQQLSELRNADLRFSPQEAETLFNQIKSLGLSSLDSSALNTRTEGWITGLQMAALSMQGHLDKSQFIRSFTGSNRYILDYLLEEVLDQQSDQTRGFLLRTSILDRLSGELCHAVSGEPDSQQILEEMERSNLFVNTLDDQRCWFRYHHLFADLLQQRLKQNQPDSIPILHRQASSWYEVNGYLAQAVKHSLSAGDYQRTVELLNVHISSIWEYGDQTRLTKWLDALPAVVLYKHPSLLAHHAFSLCFSGQFSAAETELKRIEENLPTENKSYAGMNNTVRAYIALYSNQIPAAAEHARLALTQLPAREHMWRTLALSIHGDVHAFYGHVPTCEQIWGDALREAELAESIFFALYDASKLVVAQKRLGKLRKAASTFQEQTRRALESGKTEMAIPGGLYTVYGDILLEWNQVDQALKNIQLGLALAERQDYAGGIAWSSQSLVHAFFVQADYSAANEALEKLETRIQQQQLPAWSLCYFTALKVRLSIQHGNLEEAQNILQERGTTINGEISYPREVEYLSLARLLIARNRSQSDSSNLTMAEHLLKRLHIYFQKMGWVDKIIETQILLALVYQAQNNDRQALEILAAALSAAEPEGYLRTFANEGSPMASLLYKALEKSLSPAYVSRILAAFPTAEVLPAKPLVSAQMIEPLSQRELEVLSCIAEGASNQETASALHIAPGTVKNHLKSIYGKLNVHKRTQAIALARRMGLLNRSPQ